MPRSMGERGRQPRPVPLIPLLFLVVGTLFAIFAVIGHWPYLIYAAGSYFVAWITYRVAMREGE